MFIKDNTIYSDAGKYLTSQNFIGFKIDTSDTTKYTEKDFEEPTVSGQFLIIGEIRTLLPDIITYASLKRKFIEWHYNNDEQIAIILNRDNSKDDLEYYNKMQEWRTWAGTMAKNILTLIQ